MSGDAEAAFGTQCVHAGQYDDPQTGAVGTPIYQCTTFHLREETYEAIHEGRARDAFVYTRYGNPSQWAVQQKMSALEGAESSIVFASGMAAITSTLLALLDRGSHVVTSRDLYGGSYNFLYEDLQRYGMSATFVDPTDPDAIEKAITGRTQLLYFETLTNPLLKLIPLEEIVRIGKRHGCRVVLDNTFLTPFNLRPLELGVDLVIHSATKYLAGHSDLVAGTVSGSRKLIDRIWPQMLKNGGSLDPHACFLLERSLKTLSLRMRAHNENARELARFLEGRPEVRRVNHPGLDSYDQRDLAHSMLPGGSGGMISFEVGGGDPAAHTLLQNLRLCKEATSLGGLETLISLPYNTSHATLTRAQREAIGIRPGLVRLSVGVEEIGDLERDFERSLEKIAGEAYAKQS